MLQVKSFITDIENRIDKNGNIYYRLSLKGFPATYFYVFSNSVKEDVFQLLQTPLNLINRQVLISYEELPNKNNEGVFYKVKDLRIT